MCIESNIHSNYLKYIDTKEKLHAIMVGTL